MRWWKSVECGIKGWWVSGRNGGGCDDERELAKGEMGEVIHGGKGVGAKISESLF